MNILDEQKYCATCTLRLREAHAMKFTERSSCANIKVKLLS